MTLDSLVTELKGIGDELGKKYARLGIATLGDLIDNYPRRYEDYSHVLPIARIKPGEVTIKAQISDANGRYVRRGMHITEAVARDDSGAVRIVWFNQPYRAAALNHGQDYYISGTLQLSHQHLSIMNPSAELVSEFPLSTARIVPVYRETKGLTSRQIRQALKQVLPLMRELPETLPEWVIKDQKLLGRASALEMMHFPESSEALAEARRRLGFEEVFSLSLASLLQKSENQSEQAPPVPFDEAIAKDFVSHLPFPLTNAQRKVAWQTYLDMQKPTPMNRLVEGDVGSGKTVVAAMAALMVLREGKQAAFMAPTELLARQHAETLQKLLAYSDFGSQVGLLVGSMKKQEKSAAHYKLKTKNYKLVVGTQALLQEKVDMQNLELIIIDEQHRFGVEQRKTLMGKAGYMPHVLSLTATPIPRSLALTLYGELDISVLDEKPPGRRANLTEICSPNSRAQLNTKIRTELDAGRQMFVVCPLISESEALAANSAEKIYEQFSKHDFKNYRVGLLHGKMKAADKQQIMQDFIDHQLDILVSTTVIEVGVDVPNATVMLIEAADRFGLAQIHQLRGRVGRGAEQGYCYLMMSDSSAPSRRLKALERINDGFRLAEIDLDLRGPGAIYGAVQHGQLDLRVAQLSDTRLIASARASAQKFIDSSENLLQYSQLHDRITQLQAVTNLN
jgi:ATP-dependent DNA helicase RecG